MNHYLPQACLTIVLAPLLASIVVGVFGWKLGRVSSHRLTILGMAISFVLSLYVGKLLLLDQLGAQQWTLYTWINSGSFNFSVGFLIDNLSAMMMITVTFVSLLVHIYSIGYMVDDPGYQRFFSYISLFTFCMLMLVMGNNFLVLFFGWEGVGLVSYLLIGFWFKKPSAVEGGLKAFLVNRVGDFGFILALGAILCYFGTLDYATVFANAAAFAEKGTTINILPQVSWHAITVIVLLLFVGAMGKSAQVPLHVWLPESMEGPTPISALIHAATMVTAGVYMVARMSPLFTLSPTAMSVVLVIGATGALFMGILAMVQSDIKRVVAYSTLSHLGYMIAAEGAGAFAAGVFHLFTHACFKALLFLAAGSVIIAMHHEQDMHKMGGLRRYLPITYVTFLIGALANAAFPLTAGFYSKDVIIDAVRETAVFGGGYAYICVLLGALVSALYIFRALFMTFHGEPRMDHRTRQHLHEPSWVVWMPLVILAIPSVLLGMFLIYPMLYAENNLMQHVITVTPQLNVLHEMAASYEGAWPMAMHTLTGFPFWFMLSGIVIAWICYVRMPQLPKQLAMKFKVVYWVLINKYGFDNFNATVIVPCTRRIGDFFYKITDLLLIDGFFVNGSGHLVTRFSRLFRKLQSGYLYHYVFVMIVGLVALLIWLLFGVPIK